MIKVAITGPESTGKSWLAENLARAYTCNWSGEYARDYLPTLHRSYTPSDLIHIAIRQQALIDDTIRLSENVFFADTEMLVMQVWSQVVFGCIPMEIKSLLEQQTFDLFLLCDTDLPWEPDPLREHPERREEIFGIYRDYLEKNNLPYQIVRGDGTERLVNAMSSLESLLPHLRSFRADRVE